MTRFTLVLAVALGLAAVQPAAAAQDEDARAAAQKAVEQSWAKAQADKARNDAIVAQQRAAEQAAKAKAATPKPASKSSTAVSQ